MYSSMNGKSKVISLLARLSIPSRSRWNFFWCLTSSIWFQICHDFYWLLSFILVQCLSHVLSRLLACLCPLETVRLGRIRLSQEVENQQRKKMRFYASSIDSIFSQFTFWFCLLRPFYGVRTMGTFQKLFWLVMRNNQHLQIDRWFANQNKTGKFSFK